ncbi:MAG: BON domain-containing protein [Burkholderiaceae bacterium]
MNAQAFGLTAAVLIAALLAGCGQGKSPATAPAPASAPAAPVAAPAPSSVEPLAFSALGGKITLAGTVTSEDAKKQLLQEATGVYGAGNVIDMLSVDPGAANPAWLEQAGTLLAWLKPGQPLSIIGDASYLTLKGIVPTAAEKTERGKWANEFFGNTVTVTNSLQVRS